MSLFERLLGSHTASGATEVDVTTAHDLQQQGAQLVDVREPYEFKAGHARGARNIPLGQLGNRLGEVTTDRTVLLICRGGNRSRVAQDLLRQHNLTDTRNVRGGMLAWHRAGLPQK
ncbi:MAG TPA: rhodanese-like domain-containing protein [Chloroflexota bacterium]|nr:rhodanese-like domain-containing protein [Chloroflexota bacterium]